MQEGLFSHLLFITDLNDAAKVTYGTYNNCETVAKKGWMMKLREAAKEFLLITFGTAIVVICTMRSRFPIIFSEAHWSCAEILA